MQRRIEKILMMGGAAALIGCADNTVTDAREHSRGAGHAAGSS